MARKSRNKTQVIQVNRLSDLPKREETIIHVELEQMDGLPTLAFDMRILSYREWLEAMREVPVPQAPPTSRAFTKDADGKIEPEYDYENPAYKRAMDERPLKINYNRLCKSLVMEFESDTLEGRIDELERYLGWGLIERLVEIMVGLARIGERTISQRADTFRQNGHSPVSGDGDTRLEREPVASPT